MWVLGRCKSINSCRLLAAINAILALSCGRICSSEVCLKCKDFVTLLHIWVPVPSIAIAAMTHFREITGKHYSIAVHLHHRLQLISRISLPKLRFLSLFACQFENISKLKVIWELKGRFYLLFIFSSRYEIELRKFQFFLLRFLERMRLPLNLCPAFRSQSIQFNGLTFMSFALDRLLHTTLCHVKCV